MTQGDYKANEIIVLEWLEPVRQRPGMYIWSTDVKWLHHLITEIVDNAIDESLAGYCKNITIKICADGRVEVYDDGRGIPTDIHPKTWKSAVETVYTVLHAGGKFNKWAYKISWWLHWVGASVVNALSEKLEIYVHRDGNIHFQSFQRWKSDGDLKMIWDTDKTGTSVRFLADSLIFETIKYNTSQVFSKYRQTAYLCPWVVFTVIDEESKRRERYYFAWGIRTRIKNMTSDQKPVIEPIFLSKDTDNLNTELVFNYIDSPNNNILSFVNNINTPDGGTHLLWFKDGLLKVINELAKAGWHIDSKIGEFQPSDITDGLYAIVTVKVPNPEFEWQTKWRLGNSYVRKEVEDLTYKTLTNYFKSNDQVFVKLLDKIKLTAKARLAAKLAKETVLRKSPLTAGMLWKLTDCSNKDRSRTELFIVEWDSAGWSGKQGRDSTFQAILPIRGKILNTERATIQNILANNEIKSLIASIGIGIKDGIDMTKLRYDKVIIMTDADVDGSHITTLLLTFFYRYMKQLIDEWHVYIACPPLYKIYNNQKSVYIYDAQGKSLEQLAQENEFGDTKWEVQRFKWLGEMNYDQLADTTMNPATRTIKRVNIEDGEEADRLFRVLMWDDSQWRKHFILDHAKNVVDIDI